MLTARRARRDEQVASPLGLPWSCHNTDRMAMRVLVAVLAVLALVAFVGLGAADVAVEDAVEDAVVKLDPAARIISLYRGPTVPHGFRIHEMGGIQQVLNGPVLVAFKDATKDSLRAFYLPKGFKHVTDYDLDDVRPLVESMVDGHQKAFLYPSAGLYLQVPEMSMPLKHITLPFSNLNTAFDFPEADSPYPFVLVLDDASIRANSHVGHVGHFDDLVEVGVLRMEKGGLRIVRENHPHRSDHVEDHAVVAQA